MARKLKEYNKKRDFTKTQEPAGKRVSKRSGKKLKFVVQEHHARHLHWDFRLELNGVLKSWAVPKGPSQNPKDKRLAVETEDHPLSYARFHGSIPKGEYGGGEVFIWDQGTWESLDADPLKAIKEGRLEFNLHGKKLSGRWLLIRTKRVEKRPQTNWLLMKRSDDKKTSRDFKADPWPGFIPPQLPKLVERPPQEESDWIHEMKFDGYRIQAHIQNGIATFYTRNGLDWSSNFPFLLEATGRVNAIDAILDGEIVALDKKGRSHFQRLQNSLKANEDLSLRYYVFDLLYLNGADLRSLPLWERKALLKKVLHDVSPQLLFSEHFESSGDDFFQISCEHNLEGIVSKLAGSPYLSGRNDYWVKTKCGLRQEFIVGGWSEPKGGRLGLGSLLLGVLEGDDLRFVGKVGIGFTQKCLKQAKKLLSKLERDSSPFSLKGPRGKDLHWVEPRLVVEVAFSQWTDEEVLRTPVFQGFREDKPVKEISMDKPRVSSPDKILYRKEGITKQEVSLYYKEIAEVMLPYLKDRPLSLVRCPSGTDEACFFQKHFSGKIPKSFMTFPVKEEKGEGTYLAIRSSEALQELVQLNAFEIHSWNCHKDNLNRPDQIVMDFDPGPGVEWLTVVEAVFELKEILDDLNLVSFVKLTGGKGLHVHIPIVRLYDWEQIKSFSQGLAWELVSRNPSRFTSNMSKNLRHNKIFIDYLRNGFGATTVAPYSLRARELSTVALPLEWNELKKLKNPQTMTLKKALRKIKTRQRDPWEEMTHLKQRIQILKAMRKAA
jgi:bifunctional non-homologous end joining protein LigD